MRLMFDFNDSNPASIHVVEITEIDATPAWNPKEGESEDNPGMYCVTMRTAYSEIRPLFEIEDDFDFDIIGEYQLDGTRETYLKAVDNYNKICRKLAIEGWCSINDFENFMLW